MTIYPDVQVGDLVTADLLDSMQPVYVAKGSDEARTSTTTLADDAELIITLAASATYYVQMEVGCSADAAGDIKTAWNLSAGIDTTGGRRVEGPGSTSNDANSDNVTTRWGIHGFTTSITYGARTGAAGMHIRETAYVTTSTGGTITLQWAQATSSLTATTVSARSFIRAERIA